jgi:hypothetical protein
MIFAVLEYEQHYADVHPSIETLLRASFSELKCGLQGDSWFWVYLDGQRIEIDTFLSHKHEVKSPVAGPHVDRVIEVLERRFKVRRSDRPILEPHEDDP